MNTRALILPGIGDSDPGHWQSLWQSAQPNFMRVQQRDWTCPVCADWIVTLEQAVSQADENVVLVAHSLGCLLVAHWAAQTARKIKGALLVASPSPTAAPAAVVFDTTASGFLPVPMRPFAFPSVVVASSDDPYSDSTFSKSCAAAWGSRLVNIGAFGHINTSSGLGTWPEGYALYQELAA
jgi:predicted alpha/beta hydrolase family esterase